MFPFFFFFSAFRISFVVRYVTFTVGLHYYQNKRRAKEADAKHVNRMSAMEMVDSSSNKCVTVTIPRGKTPHQLRKIFFSKIGIYDQLHTHPIQHCKKKNLLLFCRIFFLSDIFFFRFRFGIDFVFFVPFLVINFGINFFYFVLRIPEWIVFLK